MRSTLVINIITALSFGVLGAFLGDGYKNPLYFYWLIVLFVYVIFVDVLNRSKEDLDKQLSEAKDQITALTITKNEKSDSVIQCSFYPRITNGTMESEKLIQIDVQVNSLIPLTSAPEIKLITDKEWNVLCQHQSFIPRKYAGRFEYLLDKPLLQCIDNKHFKYSFDVKFSTSDTYHFKMVLDNGEVQHEINNSFKISQRVS
ncbi:hypothetical protein P5630_11715 [Bacillus subtilis]|nr:hypothetical protein P5652_06785 [Bacillus subtilis]WGD68593.1 hypothetical protein P5630_11715 [Bacillus subtilis]WGD74438.1 hypothetical protein P5668_11620 [Bacillus subtilis]WGD89662.1 hypothetical protein P5665_11265 [Bacillus subtilis]